MNLPLYREKKLSRVTSETLSFSLLIIGSLIFTTLTVFWNKLPIIQVTWNDIFKKNTTDWSWWAVPRWTCLIWKLVTLLNHLNDRGTIIFIDDESINYQRVSQWGLIKSCSEHVIGLFDKKLAFIFSRLHNSLDQTKTEHNQCCFFINSK